MKASWPRLDKADLERNFHKDCLRDFGTPEEVTSFRAPVGEHHHMTNELFLNGGKPVFLPKPLPKPKEAPAKKSSSGGKSSKDSGAQGAHDGPRSNNPFAADDSLPKGGVEASLPDVNVSGNSIPDQDMPAEDNMITETKKDAIPEAPKTQTRSPTPDYRALVFSMLEDEGVSFEYCKDAEDLCECLVHSMLGTI